MTIITQKHRLTIEANQFKKTWLIGCIMAGQTPHGLDAIIPNYKDWNKKELLVHIRDLRNDINDIFSGNLTVPENAVSRQAIKWFSIQFDRWHLSGFGIFTLSSSLQ